MATLNIGKAHITLEYHDNHQPENVQTKGKGVLTRISNYASSAQEMADRYADNSYNQAERDMFRL
jgi:hypothetical protein